MKDEFDSLKKGSDKFDEFLTPLWTRYNLAVPTAVKSETQIFPMIKDWQMGKRTRYRKNYFSLLVLNQSGLEVTFRELKIKQLADWSPQNKKSENSETTFLVPPWGHHREHLEHGPLHSSLSVVDLSPKKELIRFHKRKGNFCRVRLISVWKK